MAGISKLGPAKQRTRKTYRAPCETINSGQVYGIVRKSRGARPITIIRAGMKITAGSMEEPRANETEARSHGGHLESFIANINTILLQIESAVVTVFSVHSHKKYRLTEPGGGTTQRFVRRVI